MAQVVEKLKLYDLMASIVPGVLLLGGIFVLFPNLLEPIQKPPVPDAVISLGIIVLAFFSGQIVQALSSLLEPALHWTWGGRPSARAFGKGLGDRYLPMETALRVGRKIKTKSGAETDRAVFLNALAIAEGDAKSRTSDFNASYGYHRSVVLLCSSLVLAFVAAGFVGTLAAVGRGTYLLAIVITVFITLLFWHRAKQRAFYFVREVLLVAERNLDNPQQPQPTKGQTNG